MTVHRELGCGFLEAVYQEALAIEFEGNGIPYSKERELPIRYRERHLKAIYRADFLCFDEVIVELKAIEKLTSRDESQLIHYLKAARAHARHADRRRDQSGTAHGAGISVVAGTEGGVGGGARTVTILSNPGVANRMKASARLLQMGSFDP